LLAGATMKIRAKFALIPLLLVGTVCAADAQEKRYRKFMPGTKITLKARKTKYFLGENILLDYQISYDGEGALAVDTASGRGSTDCTVIAIDQDGKKSPPLHVSFTAPGQAEEWSDADIPQALRSR